MSLFSRIAIVTGATSGIGEAIAKKFVTHGFGVVGNGRNRVKLASLQEEMGQAFIGVSGDAAETLVLDELFVKTKEHFGREADIVVANAGRGLVGSVKDADLSPLADMLKINLTGTLLLLQRAAQRMVEKGSGTFPTAPKDIVIIGSVVGRHISPFSAIYSATKFAVHALAEGLRRELGPQGIRVSLVEPGFVLSGFQHRAGFSPEMVKMLKEKFGPLLRPEDVADAVHYIVTRPPYVHISDIIVRPTRQDYP